jgi:hypothetical protein
VRHLVDQRLLERDLPIAALDARVHREHQFAQLLRVQLGEVRGVDHRQ